MTSLSKSARAAGLLYVLAAVVGVLRLLYIPSALFVHGDATATANNIAAHESLFRWGIVSEPLGYALWLFVPLALYRLLKRSEEHTSELQSPDHLVCRLLLEKKKNIKNKLHYTDT